MKFILFVLLTFTFYSCNNKGSQGIAIFVNDSSDKKDSGNSKDDSNTEDSTPEIITPTKLVFTSELQQSIVAENLMPGDITVEAQDESGNTASDFNGEVTLAIATDPSAGTANLSGTLSATAVNGVATFSGISIDLTQSGYTLIASTTSLESAVSNSVDIVDWVIQYGANTVVENAMIESPSNSDDRCERGHIDSNGFIYCAGRTKGNFIDTNAGADTFDAIVIKYNPHTRKEVAAFQLGASSEGLVVNNPSGDVTIGDLSGNEQVKGIEVDSAGNVYLVGTTTSNMTESQSNQDIFVIKLDSSLENILWLKHFGQSTTLMNCPESVSCNNTYVDYATSIDLDNDGNLYIGGMTNSDIYNNTRHDNSYHEMLAFKMNPNGEVQWVYHPVANTENSTDWITDIKVKDGYVYFAGTSGGFWIETPGAQPAGWGGRKDAMYGKLNASNGSVEWLKQINTPDEGSNGILSTEFYEVLEFMTLDSDGNLYMLGETRSAFGQPKVTSSSNPYLDLFVIKAEPINGDIQWTYHLGGDADPDSNYPNPDSTKENREYPAGIEVDSSNNVNIAFRSKSQNFIHWATGYDGFLLKLDSTGNPVGDNKGITQYNGVGGNSSGDDLFFNFKIDSNDKVYVFGFSSGNYVETATGTYNLFVHRLDFE